MTWDILKDLLILFLGFMIGSILMMEHMKQKAIENNAAIQDCNKEVSGCEFKWKEKVCPSPQMVR